jgi:hypothetical protein
MLSFEYAPKIVYNWLALQPIPLEDDQAWPLTPEAIEILRHLEVQTFMGVDYVSCAYKKPCFGTQVKRTFAVLIPLDYWGNEENKLSFVDKCEMDYYRWDMATRGDRHEP